MRIAMLVVLVGCGGPGGGDDAPPNADELFEEPVRLPLRGSALAITDLDADGNSDLIIGVGKVTATDPTIIVRAGRPDRTFVEAGSYVTTVSGIDTILLADVDGNSVDDLVVGRVSSRIVTVLPGVAGGTFGAEIRTGVDASTHELLVERFDADEILDVLTDAHFGVAGDAFAFMPGGGDGTFGAAIPVPLGDVEPGAQHAADFDGDGKLDLAVGDLRNDAVVIYRGNGDGTFAELGRIAGALPVELLVAELDGDGKPDLLAIGVGEIHFSHGNGDGTFAARVTTEVTGAFGNARLLDVDGDGRLDLVTDSLEDAFFVLLGRGDGGFDAPIKIPLLTGSDDFGVGDFDADSHPDLAVVSVQAGEVVLYFGR